MPKSRILIRSHLLLFGRVLFLGLALSGCAGTTGSLLKALDAPERPLEQAVDTREPDDALRMALRKKAEHLVAERKKSVPTVQTGAPLSANVAAMLAQARQPVPAPAKAQMNAQMPSPLPVSTLSQNFHVKAQARLPDALTPHENAAPSASMIRFSAGKTQLDETGNKILAALAAKSELSPRYTVVLVAGLNGSSPAWERMRMASERLDTVAAHVPPPLGVERKLDPALDGNVIRLELKTDQR